MLTALDAPPEALDRHEQNCVALVREHGWMYHNVMGDAEHQPFIYSTGWWKSANHPEIIVFGLRSETASAILWDLYREVVAGDPLPIATRTDRAFARLPAYLLPVNRRFYPDYLGWSRWFYGNDDWPCLHLVWPDREGRFPWEDGVSPDFARIQPDLTTAGWRASLSG